MTDMIRVELPQGWSGPNGATTVVVPKGTSAEQLRDAFGPKQSWGTTLSEIPARAFGSFADMFGNAPTNVENLAKAAYGYATGHPEKMAADPNYVTNMLQGTGDWRNIGAPHLSRNPMTPAEQAVSGLGQAALAGITGSEATVPSILRGAAVGGATYGAGRAAHVLAPNSVAAPILASILTGLAGSPEAADKPWAPPTVQDLRSAGLTKEGIQTALAGHSAGYKMTPSSTAVSRVADALQSWGGKAALENELSAHNSIVTNRLAAEDLGLHPNTQLTRPLLASLREQAGKAYDAISSLPIKINTTPAFRRDIARIGDNMERTAARYPNIVNTGDVQRIKADLMKPTLEPSDAINLIRVLRQGAQSDLHTGANGPPPPERIHSGLAKRQAADAIEGLVEKNLKASPHGRTLYNDFVNARRQIAKIHNYEDSLNDATGTISSRRLAILDSMNPGRMSGNARLISRFAKTFPRLTRTPESMGGTPALSYLDSLGGLAGLSELTGMGDGNVFLGRLGGALLARPVIRKALATRTAQSYIMPKEKP